MTHDNKEIFAVFEGLDDNGEWLYSSTKSGDDDIYIHVLPELASSDPHQVSDECWCGPRVEFIHTEGGIRTWRLRHCVDSFESRYAKEIESEPDFFY